MKTRILFLVLVATSLIYAETKPSSLLGQNTQINAELSLALRVYQFYPSISVVFQDLQDGSDFHPVGSLDATFQIPSKNPLSDPIPWYFFLGYRTDNRLAGGVKYNWIPEELPVKFMPFFAITYRDEVALAVGISVMGVKTLRKKKVGL